MSRRTAAVLALVTVLAMPLAGPAAPASAAASGQWKISCGYVGSAPDDPIVAPGRPGATHLHDFFGNSSVSASSTYASMRGMASSCPQLDRAAYWTPALYRDGRKVRPAGITAYYTNSVSPGEERIEPFPPDFKMVTGDARNSDPAAVSPHIRWGCLGSGQTGRAVPRTCASGGIQLRVTFPSCWNGKPRTGDASADMRFPSLGRCPAGFPRALPTLRVSVAYPTGADVGAITLASGPVSTIHADFWNTWDQPRLTRLVQQCLHAKRQCAHFTGITPGAVPGTLLGTGPPLAPTSVPDEPAGDAPGGGAPGDGAPGDGAPAGDPGAQPPARGQGAPDSPVPAPPVQPPAGRASAAAGTAEQGPAGQGPAGGGTRSGADAGDAAGTDAGRAAVDTPTVGAPPWTQRRTQVLDEEQESRPASGKQQTWTFAAEQEPPPAWVGLAGAGVAVLCLIAGGLWLARHRRATLSR